MRFVFFAFFIPFLCGCSDRNRNSVLSDQLIVVTCAVDHRVLPVEVRKGEYLANFVASVIKEHGVDPWVVRVRRGQGMSDARMYEFPLDNPSDSQAIRFKNFILEGGDFVVFSYGIN